MENHGPPPDVPAESVVEILKMKPRPSKVVPCPVEALQDTSWANVRIVVPPSVEHSKAQLAAHARMRDDLKIPREEWATETGAAILGDLVAKEMLARTLFSEHFAGDSSNPKYARMFGNSKDVENALSADETAILFGLMQQTLFEIGPRLSILTDEEVDAWVEVLAEGLDPLAYLVLPDLHVLIRGLVRRIKRGNVPLDTSPSPGSQPLTSLDSLGSPLTSSTTVTTSSGEQQSKQPNGSRGEPLTPGAAAAIARKMSKK